MSPFHATWFDARRSYTSDIGAAEGDLSLASENQTRDDLLRELAAVEAAHREDPGNG
jgi:hypothetical protein